MDCKGEMEEISYPNIFFTVDNYDEVSPNIKIFTLSDVYVVLNYYQKISRYNF